MAKKTRTPKLAQTLDWSITASMKLQIIKHYSRGFLHDMEVFEASKTRQNGPYKADGKVALTSLTAKLRGIVEAAGLPTDKHPVMPKELDHAYDPSEHGTVQDDDLWIDYVHESTEPLSEERIAADFLHATNRVLAAFSDEDLKDIFRVMRLYHLYATLGDLNNLALAGRTFAKGQASGPMYNRKKSNRTREIVADEAERYWQAHPNLRGQHAKTGERITSRVNERRVAEVLGKPLKEKSVADHLRRAMKRRDQ